MKRTCRTLPPEHLRCNAPIGSFSQVCKAIAIAVISLSNDLVKLPRPERHLLPPRPEKQTAGFHPRAADGARGFHLARQHA